MNRAFKVIPHFFKFFGFSFSATHSLPRTRHLDLDLWVGFDFSWRGGFDLRLREMRVAASK